MNIDDLISGADDEFFGSLKGIDERFAREIIKIYASFVIGGELVLDAELLAKLDASLIAAIGKTDYKLSVNAYLPNFEAIEDMNKILHKELNDININNVINENLKIANFKEVIKSQLKGTPSTMIKVINKVGTREVIETIPIRNASLDQLIDPIAEIMRKDIILGVDFASATESILDEIGKKNLGLEQWADQIARDALNQSDGIVQDEIRKEFKMPYITYTGTISAGTRPFCYHMVKNKKTIKYSDLQTELNKYIPNGIPSESRVKTHSGRKTTKGAGMIPGTDDQNFLQRRGGYRCAHRARPTKKPPVKI